MLLPDAHSANATFPATVSVPSPPDADFRQATRPAHHPAPRPRWHAALALAVCALTAGALLVEREIALRTSTTLPSVAPTDLRALFFDDTPIPVTISEGWVKVRGTTTPDALRGDLNLWRRMHVSDWDTVPNGLREQGLDAMLLRYRQVLLAPAVWDTMSGHDWDLIPPPVRALAFRHMLQYWTGYYHVGARHGLAPRLVADTAAAIVMSESWFDHRAEHTNQWGNRDVGLAQASGFARVALAKLVAEGASDIMLAEHDYFNPWLSTRFVAIWLNHLLDELDGDLNAAVRAYHRGARNARRGEGADYLAAVLRRRHEYMQNRSRSPSWRYLWERDRDITRQAWPWLNTRRTLSPGRDTRLALDRPGDPQPTWWQLALTPPPSVD